MDTVVSLNAVKNKLPGVSNLIKKADYDPKISDIKAKYFTTFEYNKFTGEIRNAIS